MSGMESAGVILVTGASGQIGRAVCHQLRAANIDFLPTDLEPSSDGNSRRCDLRNKQDIAQLFQWRPVRALIHLAAILPSAFRADPFLGAEVNLTGTIELVREAVNAHVQRFVFASSRSVYGVNSSSRLLTEEDPVTPQDTYGAAKCAIESIGEILDRTKTIEFVSLRIATVVGPGVQRSASVWRSQIFEGASGFNSMKIPHAASAMLPLVYVDDVARALIVLAHAPKLGASKYNTPVEIWKVSELKEVIEKVRGSRVELADDKTDGGPLCDGSRFLREFAFQVPTLRERLSAAPHD
jgi:UDP-glucose 4-epimerase